MSAPLARTASGASPFTVAWRADRHEGRRRHRPVRRRDFAAAGGAVGGEQAKRKSCVGHAAKAYGSVGSREKLLSVPSAKYDLQRLCNHFRLVVRFRSSPQLAARLDANFGIKGLATL